MLPTPQRLSLVLCGAVLLFPPTAAADPGRSVALEVLGWDPVDRKVFVAEHAQEAGLWLPPAISFFLLDAEDPSLPVLLRDPADLAALPGGGDLRVLRRVLEPLVPVEPVGLEVRERHGASGPCAGLPAPEGQPACRAERVELTWHGQVQEVLFTGWGGSDVLGAWAVPGTDCALVVHSYLAPGGVLGLPQESALLFLGPQRPVQERVQASVDPRRMPRIGQY
jgi:hypothetical protein